MRSVWHLLPLALALALAVVCARYGTGSASIVPFFLGSIAAALTELDYSGRQGLRFWTFLWLLFVLVSLITQISLHYGLFALWLTVFAFISTALAVMSVHHQTAAFALLVLALYTALSHHEALPFWHNPLYLAGGVALYAVASLFSSVMFPQRPVQQALKQLDEALGHYMQQKALFFNPDEAEHQDALHTSLNEAQRQVIEALNHCRYLLFRRRASSSLSAIQHYFVAQEIHERFSSTHLHYAVMAKRFAHDAILFRIHNLMQLQAQYVQDLWQSPSATAPRLNRALHHLQRCCKQSPLPQALQRVLDNLSQVQAALSKLSASPQDPRIHAPQYSWLQLQSLLKQRQGRQGMAWRHAWRLSLLLALSFILIAFWDNDFSYWLVLTIIFVSQAQFSSTQKRIQQRIIGTLLGVLVAALIPYFLPSEDGKIALMLLATLCFYHFRRQRYAYSTFFMTLQALAGLSLLGANLHEALPWRLWDTVLGAALVWLGARYVFPEWQYQKPRVLLAEALQAIEHYGRVCLLEAAAQDDLSQRLARRQAYEQLLALAQCKQEWQSYGRDTAHIERAQRHLDALMGVMVSLVLYGRSQHDWRDAPEQKALLEAALYAQTSPNEALLNDDFLRQQLARLRYHRRHLEALAQNM